MLNSQVDEIKSRLDIVEVVREYIPNLKQAGSNWRALCPFHNEKTPSFMVSRDKQIWHCFGCGEGGDIFSFLMKIENLEFPETLKILAKKAGVILKYQDPSLTNQKTKILDILETAAKFFHHNLLNSKEATEARDYLLNKRGLKEETVEDFYLGFAPNSWDELFKFLLKKGFKGEEIFLAGLAVKKERGTGFYDRFRARIMFPIRDVHGHVVGFTGRLLPGDEKKEGVGGKYVNTPQTLVYNKSQVIYGLDKAKQAIRKENLAVLVEGNMDVIASHQAGITNVVASSGTALTAEQVKLLKRYSENLAISFDADSAGEAASRRGIDVALEQGATVKVIVLDPKIGKDPDEYIKKACQKWIEAISGAQLFMDYYFGYVLNKLDLNKVESKKEAAKILLKEISKLQNKIEQSHYLQKLGETLGVSEQVLRESLQVAAKMLVPRSNLQSVNKNTSSEKPPRDRNFLLSERLLSLAIKYPDNLPYIINHLSPETIRDASLQELYKNLILYYNNINTNIDRFCLNTFCSSFLNDKNRSLLRYKIDTLLLLAEKDFCNFNNDEIKSELQKSVRLLKENYLIDERKKIEREMKEAERRSDYKKIFELSEKFNRLMNFNE